MSPREAERAARIELGGAEQVKEQVREVRIGNCFTRWSPIAATAFDNSEEPGFAAVAIVTLAAAIGANAVAFSALNACILRPLNVPSRRVSTDFSLAKDLRELSRIPIT